MSDLGQGAATILLRKSYSLLTSKATRWISGAAVMGFGVYDIARAVSLGPSLRAGLLCIG